ncbi:BatD family protein [Sulfurimonas sp. MAG313]|nr:BatD family protein [Sulfurimonas sp. MAG313]MDF1880721.1 BatD family protein [Sulfurimonas sp. MAG313]
MLMKLGKILFFILLSTSLSASVEVISPSSFMQGEVLEFQIVAKGFKVHIPPISKIDGYLVETIKRSEEAVIINTKKATKLTKTYQIFAKDDILLPSFKVLVDNEIQESKAKKIGLKKISKTLSKNFDLEMHLNKTTAYIGEKLVLTVTFRYKDVDYYEFPIFDFSGFLLKELSSKESKDRDGYYKEELIYSLIPQKEGNFIVPAIKVDAEILKKGFNHLNNRSKYIKKIPVYSNKLQLKIKALPEKLSVFGEYKLSAKINKQSVKWGEVLVLELSLEGEGNINNLNSFSLQIPGTSIYNKEDKIDEHKKLRTKTFEIISDKDFIIPSFTLKYFDIKENKQKLTRSKSFEIKVINNGLVSKETGPSLDRFMPLQKNKETITDMEKMMFFFIGVFSTLVLMIIYKIWKKKANESKEPLLLHVLKQIKDQEPLFKKVVPHLGKDRALDRLIYLLEGEKLKNFKKIKKELIQRMKIIVS